MSPHHCVLSAIMYDYWRACNNLVEQPQFNPVIYFYATGLLYQEIVYQ